MFKKFLYLMLISFFLIVISIFAGEKKHPSKYLENAKMYETLILAGATLISGILSGILIILNEWLKRYLDKKHKKKMFELWREIYNTSTSGKEFSQPDPILYELLKDELIELQISVGAKGSIISAIAKGFKPTA